MEQTVEKNYDVYFREKVEQDILGTIILLGYSPNVRKIVLKHNLLPGDFLQEIHQEVFWSIMQCYEKGINPVLTSVCDRRPEKYRHNNSAQFDVACVTLTQKALATDTLLDYNIMLLKEHILFDFWNSKSRDMLFGNWNGRDVLVSGDLLLDDYSRLYKRLTQGLTEEAVDYEQRMIENVTKNREGQTSGIPTTVSAIDSFTAGYSPGEFFVLAGRPGMGKSTFMVISAWETSALGNKVAIFSLEMSKWQLKNKIASKITKIDYAKIKSGDLTDKELREVISAGKTIDESNLYIYDAYSNLEEIMEKAQELHAQHGVRLFFVDHIQRMSLRKPSELRVTVTTITREFKNFARVNNACWVGLSQLSRKVEERPNKRPRLSDLKESSSIEEDADVVAFFYRDGYYREQMGEIVPHNELFETDFIIAKGRDVGTKPIKIFMNPISMKIHNYNVMGIYND